MRLVDAHCHLHDAEFDADRESVVRRARGAGVVAVVTSSLGYVDALKALQVARKYRGYVHVCIGLDPANLNLDEAGKVQELILRHKDDIVGVGEVGLDYYRVGDGKLRDVQRRLFRRWIEFAEELSLPLVVHSRSAGKYAVQMLLEGGYHRVLMHAYDGRVGWALKASHEGIYFSIPTSVWYSRQKQKLVRALPLDCLMVESDCPVLSPVRGERNEPANLVYAVKKIAELKGVSEEEVAETTTRNAERFFQLRI